MNSDDLYYSTILPLNKYSLKKQLDPVYIKIIIILYILMHSVVSLLVVYQLWI